MKSAQRNPRRDDFAAAHARLDAGGPVRAPLAPGGRLVFDRPLPFLCLYRPPAGRDDAGTARLVRGEAAYLIAPAAPERDAPTRRLVRAVAARGRDHYGAFLLLEIATPAETRVDARTRGSSPCPGFHIQAGRGRRLDGVVAELKAELGAIRILRHPAWVNVARRGDWAPDGCRVLFGRDAARRAGLLRLGLEIEPVFRTASGEIYPIVLRRLQRLLAVALRRAFYHFASQHGRRTPASFKALGQRTLVQSVRRVDRELAAVADGFDLLLDLTPVNLEAAWRRFRRQRFSHPPRFYYRPLAIDPMRLKRRLFAVRTERIGDPTLAALFREKQLGLDRELSLLLERGSRRFIHESLQVFGAVDQELAALARELLASLPAGSGGGGRQLDAAAVAERAREEIAGYRRQHPGFRAGVHIRDDIPPGLMVSHGQLLIGSQARVNRHRIAALLHHEIGTHALTYHNGRTQALSLLAVGLPGYDELQEGLAVLAEFLCGGLGAARLRLLAGRVRATELLVAGAEFGEAFGELHRGHAFAQRTAFHIAARVWRGGGLTKDAVYLRGLQGLLDHLAGSGALEPLFVGKIALHHLPMIEELTERGVLQPPPLQPRYLQAAAARRRLEWLRLGRSVTELVGSAAPEKFGPPGGGA